MLRLAGLLAVLAALATPAAAASGECTVFEHANYRGASASVARDEPVAWVGDRWNDRISSVICAPRCRLDAFEHRDFHGDRARFSGETAFVGNSWNDRISSMKVRCSGGDPGWPAEGGGPGGGGSACIAFEHRDLDGKWFRLDAGLTSRSLGSAWNDRISSFLCEPGCQVTVYEHKNFGGDSRPFDGRVDYVGNRWNDRISSLTVQCGG